MTGLTPSAFNISSGNQSEQQDDNKPAQGGE